MPRLTAHFVHQVGIFLLVAFTAAGLVIIVIYFVSSRAEEARRDEAHEIAKQIENEANQDQPADIEEPASDSSAGGQDSTDEEAPTEDTNELPATGGHDSVMNLIAVSLLSFSTALYIGSRRHSLS